MEIYLKHVKGQSHSENAWITHELRTDFRFCAERNLSVKRTWNVSDCKWMCVEGGLCMILSFERFKLFPTHNCASMCVIHESACVVYASSMRDYARDTRRPSVLMRRNWFETARITHKSRTDWVCASKNWPVFRGVGGRNHWRITHEPRTCQLQN
jgi:hypothetical protein